ncbi:MAG: GDSL-type esterase/lipase family protein, partial [Candidatus Nanopelagicales bacterium]
MARVWARRAAAAAAALAVGVVALLVALLVTPATSVTAFGQALRLGAVSPMSLGSWSGPGQADLFGEGPVDTALVFEGPIRPRIVWQRFSRDPAASDFVQMSADSGPSFRTADLGELLGRGWTEYIVRLVAVTALIAGVLRLAATGAATAVRRQTADVHPRGRAALGQVAVAVAAGTALAIASVGATVLSARSQLAAVTSLADLTGTAPLVPPPERAPRTGTDARLVVIGDSTAAGVGNSPLPKATQFDDTCGRSRDAYAVVLGNALDVATLNLACSSATIESGLLGEQREGDVVVPPQVGVLKSLPDVGAVIVSVGANDVGWADFLRLCYGLERCDDTFSRQLFSSRLDEFRIRYAQLLQQLAELPGHPSVIVLQYYDPFGDRFDCP